MWRMLIHRINDIKIKNKLIIAYIFVVMLPVLVIGGVVVNYMRQDALNNAIEQTTTNVERIKNQLTTMLRVPINISNELLFDSRLSQVVNTRYDRVYDLVEAYRNYQEFDEYQRLYSEVSAIRFYATNDTLQDNLEFMRVNSDTRNSDWYQAAINSRKINWFYRKDDQINTPRVLSLVRKINFTDYTTSGVLVIELSQSYLNSLISAEPFETMILDDRGNIVSAKNTELIGKRLDDPGIDIDIDLASRGIYEREVNGQLSNIVVDELIPDSSMNGLKIVSVFSNNSIVRDSNMIILIGTGVLVAILLIGLLFLQLISLLITRRLSGLSRQINRVGTGDLKVSSNITGMDEIGQLSRKFNDMVLNIRQLMDQVYETNERNTKLEISQRDINFKMLASQMNPHFLFNALESIRMKAHVNGEKEIAYIVRLLGKLIRNNLEIGSKHTTIHGEMELVRSYLEIQKFRFGDRLSYELLLDPQTGDTSIPPLIIQPLVENAIIHGMESRESGGLIIIRTLQIEHDVLIDVIDNGSGMSAERLKQVRQSLRTDNEGDRIGLKNVHQRLTLSYGEAYGLHISSTPHAGTQISFKIPASDVTESE
ncbi:cache domain-containing sensor histidine kinase [Paenibacillus kandeliae]|uniref:cache domain-containing sensor histidine kinase n=1 Tax=Paenibacillus kandeliae TaxID=3231269 RepID=UPI00345790A8